MLYKTKTITHPSNLSPPLISVRQFCSEIPHSEYILVSSIGEKFGNETLEGFTHTPSKQSVSDQIAVLAGF